MVDDSLPSTEPGTPNPELAETDRELAKNDPEKAAPAASLAASVPSPPPDGGLQAWLAVLGGFCVVFASFGWINCMYYSRKPVRRRTQANTLPGIGVFQDYYQTHQLSNYSPSTVAWIPATESFFMFFCVRTISLSSSATTCKENQRRC
jgi:hypothetical protein